MGKRRTRDFDLSDGFDGSDDDPIENLAPPPTATASPHPRTDATSDRVSIPKRRSAKRRRNNQEKLAKHCDDLLSVHQRRVEPTSLESVLRQALTTRDRRLLDSILTNDDLLGMVCCTVLTGVICVCIRSHPTHHGRDPL